MVKNWLYYQYKNNPNLDFLIQDKEIFSFSKFYFLVADLSKSLHFNGLKIDQKVLILLEDSVSILQCFFSCQQIGAVPVLIDPNKKSVELNKIISSLSPDLIITTWNKRIINNKTIYFEEIMSVNSNCSKLKIIKEYKDEAISCVMCTSGSTGEAKLVPLTYGNIFSSFKSWNNEMNFQSDDKYGCCIALHHIGGLSIILRATMAGFSVNLCLPFKSDLVKAKMKKTINYISLVPAMLEKILSSEKLFNNKLKAVIMGGDKMSNQLLSKAIDLKIPVYKTYGMTETSSGISGFFVNDFLNKSQSSGRPFKSVSIKIKGNAVVVNGPMVMKGYLNQNESKSTFHTDDVGDIDSDGFITIHGRNDRTILSGGEKISLDNIESCIMMHPQISKVKACGLNDSKWGNRLIVAIDFRGNLSLDEIYFWCKQNLNHHDVPKDFIHGVQSIKNKSNIINKQEWVNLMQRYKLLS